MNTACLALVASMLLTAQAHADEAVATEDGSIRIAALQSDRSTSVTVDSALLDKYAGRYEIADGRVFIVLHEADSLTIELPAELALPPQHLTAASPHEFYSPDGAVRVVFEVDAGGGVTGAVVHIAKDATAIVASKAPLPHGIVMIYDIDPAGSGGS
jgi:hypothetical protein